MSIYTKAFLLGKEELDGQLLTGPSVRLDYMDVYRYIKYLYDHNNVQFLVYNFYDAPELLRKFARFEGGDEDFLIVCRQTDVIVSEGYVNLPIWMSQRYDDADIYQVEDFRIIVGSH